MRRVADAHWFVIALLAGIAYALIGWAFAIPRTHVFAWRYAAWIVSGVIFAIQIANDVFRMRSAPRSAALHAAIGVAIGGFGIALMGLVHSYRVVHHVRRTWQVALVLFPLVTALPAFLVAWVAAVALKHVARPDLDRAG